MNNSAKKIFAVASLLLFLMNIGLLGTANAQTISLDGLWEFRFDSGAALEDVANPAFIANDKMLVPGCWDVLPQYLKQRGTAQYRREIVLEQDVVNAWWRVEGMGLRSEYYIDGRKIGASSLPYSSFELETGPLTAGRHIFTTAVDNRFDGETMKMFSPFYDFYAFGGFYHGMSLTVQTTKTQIHRLIVRTLDYRKGEIELELQMSGQKPPSKFSVEVSIDGT
ncbi:MAG: hypothetical protein KBS57_02210, partial [Alistipes sp.]|nr:hypothetical protein [Candidatus Minthomonas equi]